MKNKRYNSFFKYFSANLIFMQLQLSSELNNIIIYSKEEAMRLGNYSITPDHLILGIIRDRTSLAHQIILSLGIDIDELKDIIEKEYKEKNIIQEDNYNNVLPNNEFNRVIKIMHLEARQLKDNKPNSLHLLLAILRGDDSIVLKSQNNFKTLNYSVVKNIITQSTSQQTINTTTESSKESNGSNTPVLDTFGNDLTLAAKQGKLDMVVGRDAEIERLTQILCRRKKNNPILIGDTGVGKSTIVDGLATRIANGSISKALLNKRVITLDISAIVSGAKYRGQFEERLKSIISEIKKDSNIILFMDEIHTIVGAGNSSGTLDAANMLKPALAKGDIRCIGATTTDEYRKSIERDSALERRFQKITITQPTPTEALNILHNIKDKYESFHNVKYTEEALKACIELSIRYITDRNLPDKAIDLLDEAGSKNHLMCHKEPKKVTNLKSAIVLIKNTRKEAVDNSDYEKAALYRDIERDKKEELEREIAKWEKQLSSKPTIIDKEDIAHVLSISTNIPVTKIAQSESSKLINMTETLKKRIIGQDDAIEKVTKSIMRNRAGLKDPNKPIGTFLFLGSTGVGKTELAKVIAEEMFNSKDNLIRVDMSEYMEKFSVSRIIGSPPGYVGYDNGGELCEKVKRKPYSVVLLDEIEKAHADVYNILLQILDEGRLTESSGRYVDFRNCVIIMTSNIGTKEIQNYGKGLGFSNSSKRDIKGEEISIIKKALKGTFTPEFLNRLDGQILFNSLTKDNVNKITDIELNSLTKRVEKAGYKLKLSKEVKKFIQEMGYDPAYGARPLKRAIQEHIEDVVAEAIVRGDITKGDVINLVMNSSKDGVAVREMAENLKA